MAGGKGVNWRWLQGVALAACWVAIGVAAQAPDGAAPQPLVLEDGRVRIGEILLDRRSRSFSVPARVIRVEPPLEFVAVARDGHKAYESLLEVQANAYEFNTACLLIGLDPEHSVAPRYHFDTEPAKGDAVAVAVSWQEGATARSYPAEQLLLQEGAPSGAAEWVYVGTVYGPDRPFLAAEMGTLIGFVHSESSLIEHAAGLGINAYGSIGGNAAALPPVGGEVQLTIRKIE